MIFTYIVYLLFFGSVAVQLVYLLFVFTKLVSHQDSPVRESQSFPPISIVIAAKDELHNLKELIPLLEKQDYPAFEIVVADDRSSDGTHTYLKENKAVFPHLVVSRIMVTPSNYTAKKYAMTAAIQKSSYDIILTTDADCRPQDKTWLKQMVSQLTGSKDVVVGVSPYYFRPGLLNAFIRYETLQTAVQYLSFTLSGIPFMGVGRNLMYRKSLFRSTSGFEKHADLLSGDDDLFVNEATNATNVAVCIETVAHVLSEPKRTFAAWVTQKRRHLSVGKRYKLKDKISIGLLWMSLLFTWSLVLPALFLPAVVDVSFPAWLTIPTDWLTQFTMQHWPPCSNFMRLVIVTFVSWFGLRWAVLARCNSRLNKFVPSEKIMWFDFLYAVYLLVFGCVTLFSNSKNIKWK